VSQIKANEKILKVTKFGLHQLKQFFNIKQFIEFGVNLTPASRRRVKILGENGAWAYPGNAQIF